MTLSAARIHRARITPRKVYLAGSYTSKVALRSVRDKINEIEGFVVNSSWLDEVTKTTDLNRDEADAIAVRDVTEVSEADVFVLDTLLPSTRGGYNVELGVALSTGAVIYRIGPIRNGFHGLVLHEVKDWQELFRRLKRW